MKNFVVVLLFFVSMSAFGQDLLNQNSLRLVPSNLNSSSVNPSDIPSESILRQMGLSEAEIKEATDFKLQQGKYHLLANDTSLSSNDAKEALSSELYASVNDTLFLQDTIKYPLGKIYGQDFFRTNSIAFFNMAFDAKAPENYELGAGDEITISVWGNAEHSETVIVNKEGYIKTQYAGRIYVGSKSLSRVISLVKNRLGSFFDLSKSQIDITLNYSRVINVNIVGEVFNPGSYSIAATNTAFNALIAAGGPNQIGSVRNIYLRRNGKTIDSLDVYKFLFDPSSSQDLYLQDNDYLYVSQAQNVIDVIGQVNRPYTYEVKSSDKLSDVIKYAGGFTALAYRSGITIDRIGNNSIKTLTVDDIASKNLSLKNGDVVHVNSMNNIQTDFIHIHTSTGVSGKYELVSGEKIYDMLLKSNSISDELFIEKAYLVRTDKEFKKEYIILDITEIMEDQSSESNIEINEYDEIYVLSKRDFLDEFEITISGGVRSPDTFIFGEGVTLSDVVLLAGGFAQESAGGKVEIFRLNNYSAENNQISPVRSIVKKFTINEDGTLDEDAQIYELQPNDQIGVRTNPDFELVRTVVLSGEVKYPGTYTLNTKTETLSELITRAGGVTIYGDASLASMQRMFETPAMPKTEIDFYDDDEEIINGFFSDGEFVQIVPIDEEERRMLQKEEPLKVFGYHSLYVNLPKALKSQNSRFNIVLNDLDSIHVPRSNNVVTITGALTNIDDRTISAPFVNKRANYYVNNFAGGFSKHNVKSSTFVITASGKVRKSKDFGLFVLHPRVHNGSTIKLTEDIKIKREKPKPIDWTKVIDSTVTKLSAIASLYILYLAGN